MVRRPPTPPGPDTLVPDTQRFRSIGLALLITAGTTVVALSWLAAQRAQPVTAAQPAPEPEGVKVLVAKIALPTGVFIQEDQLRWQIWPVDNLPETYLTEEETKIGRASCRESVCQ